MLIFFIIIILHGSFLVRGAGGREILSALIRCFSGLLRWFWYTSTTLGFNAIFGKKKKRGVFPIGPIYILYVCSVTVCFPWENTVFWCWKRVCFISHRLYFNQAATVTWPSHQSSVGKPRRRWKNKTQLRLLRADTGLILRLLDLTLKCKPWFPPTLGADKGVTTSEDHFK